MKTDLLLGVDIGTQGAKGILCDLGGNVLASDYREHTISSPHPGWAEHDADRIWWRAFMALSEDLLKETGVEPARIAAVGVSAFVPSMLAVDSRGRPLRTAILYTDRRAEQEVEQIVTLMTAEGYSEEEIRTIALASPISQYLWLRNNEPDAFRKTAKIAQCQNYLVYRLTGRWFIDHAMKRSYHPLYDAQLDGWSAERARLLDLQTNVLPDEIAWATQIAGKVHQQAASETRLLQGTPVAVGTADSFAEMVGAGVVHEGAAAAIYGSFTAILIGRERPVNAYHGFHCLPGLYFSGAAAPTGAALTRWFRDQFGQAEIAGEQSTGESAYQFLEQLAANIPPGCEGLIALPYFTGEKGRLHPQLNQGALIGLTTCHTRGHLYRALLEGIAYELRYQLSASGEIPAEMNAVGGGSQSKVWTQIMSDVLGNRQHILATSHGAALGDAYLAGMAAGIFKDTSALRYEWIRTSHTIESDPQARDIYNAMFEAYMAARNALL